MDTGRRRDRRGDIGEVREGALADTLAPPGHRRPDSRRLPRRRHARVSARTFRSLGPPRNRTGIKRIIHPATLRSDKTRRLATAPGTRLYEPPLTSRGPASTN